MPPKKKGNSKKKGEGKRDGEEQKNDAKKTEREILMSEKCVDDFVFFRFTISSFLSKRSIILRLKADTFCLKHRCFISL